MKRYAQLIWFSSCFSLSFLTACNLHHRYGSNNSDGQEIIAEVLPEAEQDNFYPMATIVPPPIKPSDYQDKTIQELLKELSPKPKEADKIASKSPANILLWAAENGVAIVVAKLLDEGGDINVKTDKGSTPLMLAALKGHEEVVKLFLDKEADINHSNKYNLTALDLASMNHRDSVAILLCNKGGKSFKDL